MPCACKGALIWQIGNFINSFMEEGLFRGVMLNLHRLRLSFARSNWLQALLFGAWHLIWVVKWYQTGVVSTPGEIGLGVVANFLPQICLGLVATVDAMGPGMSIRMTTFSIVSLLMMFLIGFICNRRNMPEWTADNLRSPGVFDPAKI